MNELSNDNLYDFLESVHRRPEMYFGKKSLTLLSFFLDGFRTALHFSHSNYDTGKLFLEEFHKWMMEKLKLCYPNTLTWSIHIPRKVEGDEEKAFDLFFALLEEFKLEKEDFDDD